MFISIGNKVYSIPNSQLPILTSVPEIFNRFTDPVNKFKVKEKIHDFDNLMKFLKS